MGRRKKEAISGAASRSDKFHFRPRNGFLTKKVARKLYHNSFVEARETQQLMV